MSNNTKISKVFLDDIKNLIRDAKSAAFKVVNIELSVLNWKIGERIQKEVLKDRRADYGKAIVKQLSIALTKQYGKGWSSQQLRHCIRFYQTYNDKEKLYTVCRELSWSHIRTLIYVEEELKRDFYIEFSKLENWSVRRLQERIKSMLFERTAISKKPEETIKKDLKELRENKKLSEDVVFRDPYILDFLGLADSYSEANLEDAILQELQRFITELGSDFAFLGRQKRITIDNRDYYIDLLFYHRRLKSLVAIDLKIGEFEAAYKGQMELYLRYLEKYEQIEGENYPIGLILCTGKNEEHVELLQLDKSNIKVAEYIAHLPSTEELKSRLHIAIEFAKRRLK